jgi:uncharacterized protein YhdP
VSADADRKLCNICQRERTSIGWTYCAACAAIPSVARDRIAHLTAELAEARGVPRQCASLGHAQKVGGFCAECNPHKTPMERLDAAQERANAAQAAEARAKKLVADVRAEWNSTKAAHAAEVQTAQAKLASVEADAAAMRADLEETLSYAPEFFREKWDLGASLKATAGRAIAERMPLLEAMTKAVQGLLDAGVINCNAADPEGLCSCGGCVVCESLAKLAVLDKETP